MINPKKIAFIHIIKKELDLNDEEYRNILFSATGVRSSKDLNDEQFKKLVKFFVRSKYYKINNYELTIKQKLFIGHLAKELEWNENHLNNFIHKYYHKTNIDYLTKKEAIKLIEALKNIKKHGK